MFKYKLTAFLVAVSSIFSSCDYKDKLDEKPVVLLGDESDKIKYISVYEKELNGLNWSYIEQLGKFSVPYEQYVFLANIDLKEVVAKRIEPNKIAEDCKEVKIMKILDDEHIPKLISTYKNYFFMEYMKGDILEDFEKKHENQSLLTKVQYSINILLQLLPIIEYIHGKSVIHNDIHDQNILIEEEAGRIVNVNVIDFGEAVFKGEGLPYSPLTCVPESDIKSIIDTMYKLFDDSDYRNHELGKFYKNTENNPVPLSEVYAKLKEFEKQYCKIELK